MQKILKEQVIDYLLDEGYVEDKRSAENIVSFMSSDWLNYIIEKKLSTKELKAAYLRGRQEGDAEIVSNAPLPTYTPKQVLKMSGRGYMEKKVNKAAKKAIKATRKKGT